MVQTDLPLTLIENIDKLFINALLHKEGNKECIYTERYEKGNIDSQYYISKEFLYNKSIIDSS